MIKKQVVLVERNLLMLTFVLATISTACIDISAILIAFGWREIRRKHKTNHQRIMVTAASFALLFFIIYMSRTTFIGDVNFAGPASMVIPYRIFLIFHIILATTGGVFGVVTLYLAFKEKFSVHRKVGPVTAVIWFCTAITGIIVYILLFILWPGGTQNGLLKAIFG